MAKSGNTIQPYRKPNSVQRSDLMLNAEIAAALAKKVETEGKIFTEEHWKKHIPIVIGTSEGEVEIRPKTYHSWICRNTVVPGMNLTLRAMIEAARERRAVQSHRAQQTQLVREAQKGLAALRKLPLGTQSKLVKKKYRLTKNGERYQSGEEVEEMTVPIDPRMVTIHQKSNEFILERLDPAYSQKNENKNLNVMVSLKDLREAAERNKPKADYEQ